MVGIGAAAKDIDVIIGPSRLARVERRRHQPALGRAAVAAAQLRLAALLGARERDAHVMDHRILHRDFEPAALAGLLPLVEGAENADRHQHPGAGVAKRGTGLDRRLASLAGDAGRAAGGLRDHVEGEALLVRAPDAETLDAAIDDAW